MTANVPERIKSRFDSLTTAQRKIADYVLKNWDKVPFMVARELGKATRSSDAAVIRFSQALGFRGFMELRAAIREDLIERAGFRKIARGVRLPDTPEDLLQASFRLDVELIRATEHLNRWTSYQRAATDIVAANRVWVVAHGTTYPLAAYLGLNLDHALGKVELLVIGYGDIATRIRAIRREDVVIGIGYVRYLPYTVEILRLARVRGARIIAITDSAVSPLARLAHEVFLVARDGVSLMWSQVGTMAIANVLMAAAVFQNKAATCKLLSESDKLWQALGHWDSQARHDVGPRDAPPSVKRGALPDSPDGRPGPAQKNPL